MGGNIPRFRVYYKVAISAGCLGLRVHHFRELVYCLACDIYTYIYYYLHLHMCACVSNGHGSCAPSMLRSDGMKTSPSFNCKRQDLQHLSMSAASSVKKP